MEVMVRRGRSKREGEKDRVTNRRKSLPWQSPLDQYGVLRVRNGKGREQSVDHPTPLVPSVLVTYSVSIDSQLLSTC